LIVAGNEVAGLVIPHFARQLIALHAQRTDVVGHLEKLVEDHSLFQFLTSMPGVAVIVIAEISGKSFCQRCGNVLLRRIDTNYAPVRNFHQARTS